MKNLTSFLKNAIDEHGVPGMAALQFDLKGITAQGVAGVRKVGTEDLITIKDLFHIGSCTKSMTATMIARLVERGKLKWTSTIAEIFPDLKAKIHPDYHAVHLKQLLCHRSGLPEDGKPDPQIFPKVRVLKGDLRQQRRELLQIVMRKPPASEPGSKSAYSNFGYAIAGAMAETVVRKRWEELMRELIFQPLRMSAGFGAPTGKYAPWGHTRINNKRIAIPPGPLADNPPALGPAGTAHCTLTDWMKYASLHLKGASGEKNLLLKPESFAALHADDYNQDYAMGWVTGEREWAKGKILFHNGSNTLWHAMVVLSIPRKTGYLIATNDGSSGAAACESVFKKMIEE